MDIKVLSELFEMGLYPVPVDWDINKKNVEKFPEYKTDIEDNGEYHSINDVSRWMQDLNKMNGLALRMKPPYFMFDFDLKNTNNKELFNQFLNIVKSTNEDVLRKVCIEKTRNGGYHIYSKFSKVEHKKPLAKSNENREVISIYTGGLLSFCYPTPGYELIHNELTDIEELTQDEFDMLCASCIYFNEYDDIELNRDSIIIEYPKEYEELALLFDLSCTDELFNELLESIDLYLIKNQRYNRKKYAAYLRKGSLADYSAKVYFGKVKKLLIMSGSFTDFPNFHSRISSDDHSWILTPTRFIYYKSKQDWITTIETIKFLCEQNDIEINKPIEQEQPKQDRSKFPFDIFPSALQLFISKQVIQHEYLAGGILAAVSTAIGNTCILEAMQGYIVKPILYMAIVAPPGASKTPALGKAFKPFQEYDAESYKHYKLELERYKEELQAYKASKNKSEPEPEAPPYYQVIIGDSTIEMISKILAVNQYGCCLLNDELIGFIKKMNKYSDTNDELEKWLSLWSGEPLLVQRVSRGIDKVDEPFCTIVGGVQPGVLTTLSANENEHNGFFHRFLFVYPQPQSKQEWQQINIPYEILNGYRNFIFGLLGMRKEVKYIYYMNEQADRLYKTWHDAKNKKYDSSQSDHIKGIIAKYQNYCLRFALIIQVMEDYNYRENCTVTQGAMEKAIRLTEYFLDNMLKAMKILTPESPVDKLLPAQQLLYNKLPQAFKLKTAIEIGESIGIKEATVKTFINRQKELFSQIARGSYEKTY